MSRSASPEKAKVKNLTWSQSLKANQAKESALSIARSPASGAQRKGKWAKCRTIAVAVRSDSPSVAERVSGGCCCCDCGYGALKHQTVYQNSYGTCHCCNYTGNCDMGCHQQFCACGGLYGEMSSHRGTQFGIPYNIFPRQNCRRFVTDLNTEAFCRNWRPVVERALSPKERKDGSAQAKAPDKRNPARIGKSTNYKKLDSNAKRETTSMGTTSPAVNKARKPEKPIKIGQKKVHESSKDHDQKKCKPNDISFLASKEITSKAQPSKFCPEELTDETKARNYQEYLDLYKQQNCKPLQPNPTYTRVAVKEEIKSEMDEMALRKPKDSTPRTDSDRIKEQYAENGSSDSLEGETELDCLHYKEITAHYQLDDLGSAISTPDSGPYQCCEEKDSYTNQEWEYITHQRGDSKEVKLQGERNFQKSGESTNANRTHAQQSKFLRSRDSNCEAIRQERRELCEKGDGQKRTHPVQRSVTPQSRGPTSYASIALQYPSAGHVQRETKNTQTECPCRESPTQTERQIGMNKASQVCREGQYSASPTPSQFQNSSLMSMVSGLDYDYVHRVLDCRQGSPRTPREVQQSHDDYHIQTPPYSTRTPPQSYRQHKSAQIAQANSIETLSSSSQSQCCQCQESYKIQYTQNMSGNIDCFRSDDESSQLDCPICTDAPPECVRYGGEILKHPQQHSPRSCMSSSRQVPVLDTVCEKRTRTVTFEDERGDMTKEQHVQESCRSLIDWERALKYHTAERGDEMDYTEHSSTCRSSSSAEHTCIESAYDDDFASCEESQPQANHMRIAPFNGCPCMYQTYMNLASMCQK
ncbi:uncharacterized protein LOC6545954 [Drosophila erecta]|nr:uncharacterized protein LOC6545954 [Drosophila erecta]